MPATMDPFLRAYTGVDSATAPSNENVPRKRNPLDVPDDGSESSGRRTSSASDRKSSLGSDSLWGDARRLSEAGVRRTSDSSVVLTEDTDSFIIGDRVWVGGNKPGTIAYIGDTQFAPGEWAGVVLDQPIGKNDGSVANIRYFQCEPKRGIFSRLTRLTRTQLLEGDMSMSVSGNGNTSFAHPPTSPPSGQSRSSSFSSGHLKVGDRVIVMSSTGSKTGMLRYIGKTEFAPGEWCGVECDDPIGKNDGSVQGVRYFTCQPMFGLFAPIGKVSLSPSPNRRPSCAVHPPGLARQNTKDSILSTSSKVSSVARKPSRPGTPSKAASVTNSTEAVLKDKEMYIEQLLKERDMERLAVTRAASQAEEAERKLDVLKQELRQVQEVSEATQADLLHQVEELKREKRDLSNQLEDDHKELDDLNFRFEEEKMTRAELEASCKGLEDRITQLENSLAEETKRADMLEQDSNRMFEADENLAKLRAILEEKDAELKLMTDSSGNQVQELKTKLETIKKECDEVTNLLKEEQIQCNKLKSVSEENKKLQEEMKIKLQNYISENEKLEMDLKNLTTQLSESEIKGKENENHCTELKLELEQIKTQYSIEKDSFIEKLKTLSEKYKVLEDENNNKTSNLSVLNLNVTQLQNKLQSKEDEISKLKEESNNEIMFLKNEIIQFKNSITAKSIDFESKEEITKMEISDLKQSLLEAKKECEVKDKKIEITVVESNKQIATLESGLQEKENQIMNLKNEYESKIEDCKAQLDAKTQKLTSTKETNEKIISENDELKKELEKIRKSVNSTEERLSELINLSESQKQTIAVRDEDIAKMKTVNEDTSKSLSALTLELGDWKRNYQGLEEKCKQIMEQKSKLENYMSELMNSSSDSSQQLSKLNDALRAKENECAALQEDIAKLRMHADSILQKSQQELQDVQAEAKADFESLQKSLDEKIQTKEKEYSGLLLKLNTTNKTVEQSSVELEKLKVAERELQKELEEAKNSQANYQYKLEKALRTISNLNFDLEKSRQGAGEVEIGLREKLISLEKNRDSLETEVKDYRSKEEKLLQELEDRKIKEDTLKETLTALTSEKENLVLKLEEKIAALSNSLESLKAEKDKSANVICDKDIEIVQLQQSVEMLKKDCERQANEIKLQENKMKEVTEESQNKLLQQLNLTNTDKDKLSQTLSEKDLVIKDLQKELEDLKQNLIQSNEHAQEHESLLNSLRKTLDDTSQTKDKTIEEIKLSKSKTEEKILLLENELENNKTNNAKEYCKLQLELDSLKTKLKESEESKADLQKLLSQKQILQEELVNKHKQMENLQQNEREVMKLSVQKIEKLEKDISHKNEENKKLIQDIEKHKESTVDVDNLKRQLKNMEEFQKNIEIELKTEKDTAKYAKELKERKEAFEKQVENLLKENNELKNKLNQVEVSRNIPVEATNNNRTQDIDPDMHIEFLNSIIGDLQRKVEQQAGEIEQLQSRIPPTTTTTGVARLTTPRLFCDICDMFDLHDTDDCPRQAMDSPPPQQAHNAMPRGSERPYCEICEMFGHDTADCEAETY